VTAAQDRTSESLDGAFLIGCGEMADRILAHDWSASPDFSPSVLD
jgi:hypothetical protein